MRLGTIIHGALGDCYEQLCAIKKIREWEKVSRSNNNWVGFFAAEDRMLAMQHFNLDMLDEIYLTRDITTVKVDRFYQFQINDDELRKEVLTNLPVDLAMKFDFTKNIKPWSIIKKHNYKSKGLKLELSDKGKQYLSIAYQENGIAPNYFNDKFVIGYLWRVRSKGGAINPLGQMSADWIIKTKQDLFEKLIKSSNAYFIVAGMNRSEEASPQGKSAGVVFGEYRAKFCDKTFNLPKDRCIYLKGLGYAAEMEIMSRCNLLLMMPSGFSEPLWMMQKTTVLALDPPPSYMLKIIGNRMPFFNSTSLRYLIFYNFIRHTPTNVFNFLRKNKLIPVSHAHPLSS